MHSVCIEGGGGGRPKCAGGAKRQLVLARTILDQRPVFTQDSSGVERQIHNLEVAGSIPAPAPIFWQGLVRCDCAWSNHGARPCHEKFGIGKVSARLVRKHEGGAGRRGENARGTRRATPFGGAAGMRAVPAAPVTFLSP